MAIEVAILERVRRSILAARRFGGRGRLVVAVSGGPDSVALLLALNQLAPELGLDLHVAHLDHGLRPASPEDAHFVADLARRLDLPATIERADVARVAELRRRGIEDAARSARFDFLARVAQATGADAVALGHTADDQAETVLLHVVRGTGLSGLRGMRSDTTLELPSGVSIRLVRPLLEVSRAETVAYCAASGVTPRHDESNDSPDFVRNRVRAEVLPLLRTINPRIAEALVRLGEAATLDDDFAEESVSSVWPDVARADGTTVEIERAAFLALAPAIRRRVLRRAFAEIGESTDGLSTAHVRAAESLTRDGAAGDATDLPGGFRLVVGYGRARIERVGTPAALPAESLRLAVPGQTTIPTVGLRILAELRAAPCVWNRADRRHADLDADLCGGDLVVRRRRPGDRLVPLGSSTPKKLQDVLVDSKIARSERDALPIVARASDESDVLWVAGVRLDNRYRVSDDTRRVLCLRVEPRA